MAGPEGSARALRSVKTSENIWDAATQVGKVLVRVSILSHLTDLRSS